MKIALFSDIHANLPALEAMFADMETRAIDATYCLGDLVGYNIWPNEVINEIRRRGIPTIAGNYDYGIGRTSDECGCAYKTDEDKTMGKVSISYTNELMQPTERNYLRTLPAHIRVEYQLNNDQMNMLLVHGSPRKINEYLFEDREEKSLLRIMQQANANILCFGHTHKPFHRILEEEKEGIIHYRHAINIGSAGKPKDGDTRGCYAILTIQENASTIIQESIKVEFVRFKYDVEKAARAVEESPLPNAYADMLRRAY
ncbi:metallophosphoesterase family protein [Pontibacter sp. 172403-2]|uniref:metallophosphoesterase family protein n=1 Tax=Pontibacter rufus TaxID=2791028 RepID=UPI0018AFFC68|nr:metallophosphoesterase family protein [Pontibacter sp. 172403-2]MBF9252214.1 metallophosphoesterase family protein [Pontibacter sp. 172403-2]